MLQRNPRKGWISRACFVLAFKYLSRVEKHPQNHMIYEIIWSMLFTMQSKKKLNSSHKQPKSMNILRTPLISFMHTYSFGLNVTTHFIFIWIFSFFLFISIHRYCFHTKTHTEREIKGERLAINGKKKVRATQV